jgi:hypothetical protein
LVVFEPKPFIRVWVTGSVKLPGRIRLSEGDDVYRAIAAAGDIPAPAVGPAPLRSEISVVVRRGPQVVNVPLVPDVKGEPFRLEDGDTVIVEPPAKVRVVFAGNWRKSISCGNASFHCGPVGGRGHRRWKA